MKNDKILHFWLLLFNITIIYMYYILIIVLSQSDTVSGTSKNQ